jgi:hypothetical protein
MLIAAAEREAFARGFTRIRVEVGMDNVAAQALNRMSGFAEIGLDPRQVKGTIEIRTGPIEVDEILITWEKDLTHVQSPRRRPAPPTAVDANTTERRSSYTLVDASDSCLSDVVDH